jgi:hypothetical protein
MGLPNFFEKSALSAASLLRMTDPGAFRAILEKHVVGISFDALAAQSREGRILIDLLVNLLARLYPRVILLTREDVGLNEFTSGLVSRARAINPDIDMTIGLAAEPTVAVVIGHQKVPSSVPCVFLGSDGWSAGFSTEKVLPCGDSEVPFGAGGAACLGAAAVFRIIFAEFLEPTTHASSQESIAAVSPLNEGTTWLSLFDFSSSRTIPEDNALITELPTAIDIGESFLVGLGAIGNSTVWALSRTPRLRGKLHLIDHEQIDLSNLQRYVLASQTDVGKSKTKLANEAFSKAHTKQALELETHALTWASYVANRGDYHFDRVMLALDSAKDRIEAQASLPLWIFNAWTQPENLGVSRHSFLSTNACVACLYLPSGPQKNMDQIYADALRATEQTEIMQIRQLLHSGAAVGRPFIERIAKRLSVPIEPLAPFANLPLQSFYTRALCGGIVLALGGSLGSEASADVPMAFQSALAGIFMAAELVAFSARLRKVALPCRTEIDLLRKIPSRLNSPALKHPSGRCLCQDPYFVRAYERKYGKRAQ